MVGKNMKLLAGRVRSGLRALEPRDICEDIVDLYLLEIFGLFPLVAGTGSCGYSNLLGSKAGFWFVVTLACFLCLGGSLFWAKRRGLSIQARMGRHQYMALIFLAVCAVSACLSGSVRESFLCMSASNTNSVRFIVSYVAAFLMVSLFGRMKAMHVRALGISTFLCSVLSVIQLTGRNPLRMYPEGLTYYNKYQEYTGEFLGTLGNVDVLAAFFCFSIPVLTVFAVRSGSRCDRILLIPAALALYVLIRSDVDAGKVGVVGCLIVSLPVVIRSSKWAWRAGVACAAAVLLGLAAVYFFSPESGFLYEASSIMHGHIDPSFGHDRVRIWQAAWELIRQRPILGHGPASGEWMFDIRVVNREWKRVIVTCNAHNVYLGYLMDTGLLGLGCYLTLIGGGFVAWFKKRRSDLSAALGAGLAGYLIQDFFSLNVVCTAPFLWIGLGLLFGKQHEEE